MWVFALVTNKLKRLNGTEFSVNCSNEIRMQIRSFFPDATFEFCRV